MLLSPARFNRMLGKKAQGVEWRRAAPCPCRQGPMGQAKYGCKACRSLGTLWGPPQPAWTALAGMKVAREYAAFGQWESGDVVFTIPSASPLWNAGEHDRVLMTDSTEPFQLVLKRGDPVNGRVREGRVTEVHRCFRLGAADAITECALPDVDAEDGSLSWPDPAGDAPDPGTQFTLTGRRHPEYFLLGELPQDRAHQRGAALPRRVALRRFQLFANVGAKT